MNQRKPLHETPPTRESLLPGEILLCLAAGFWFWLHRAQLLGGDGELIVTLVEGGVWVVSNEMLAQVLLQVAYQAGRLGQRTPLEVINGVSCLAGVITLAILLRGSRIHWGWRAPWPFLLFCSTGFLLFACGHTEYYPLLLPCLFAFGFAGLSYFKQRCGFGAPLSLFLLGCALHFVMLCALPALIALPWLAGRRARLLHGAMLITGIAALFVIRTYSARWGVPSASISPAVNFLPLLPSEDMYRYYAFWDRGMAVDWLYAWAMRSWIIWPALVAVWLHNRNRAWNPERGFLLLYAGGFILFSLVWHPDLGMRKDWDLFALETAASLMLLLSLLRDTKPNSAWRATLAIACLAAIALRYEDIAARHHAQPTTFSALEIQLQEPEESTLLLDGKQIQPTVPQLRSGYYSLKWINRKQKSVRDYTLAVPESGALSIRLPAAELSE